MKVQQTAAKGIRTGGAPRLRVRRSTAEPPLVIVGVISVYDNSTRNRVSEISRLNDAGEIIRSSLPYDVIHVQHYGA